MSFADWAEIEIKAGNGELVWFLFGGKNLFIDFFTGGVRLK